MFISSVPFGKNETALGTRLIICFTNMPTAWTLHSFLPERYLDRSIFSIEITITCIFLKELYPG
jgi:hypothetical protein